jgi:hypothetical protein
MQARILRWLGCLDQDQKLVRVRSWWPSLDPWGVCWPCMLVDRRGGGRETCSPVWFYRERK